MLASEPSGSEKLLREAVRVAPSCGVPSMEMDAEASSSRLETRRVSEEKEEEPPKASVVVTATLS